MPTHTIDELRKRLEEKRREQEARKEALRQRLEEQEQPTPPPTPSTPDFTPRGDGVPFGGAGREGSPFARGVGLRDPLSTIFRTAAIPAEVGAAFASEGIGLERALAERIGISGRAVDPLDISPDTALLRLARGDLGPQEDVGFRDFVDAINQRRSERNFGQNLLLDIGADPLNLAPGVGFTNLTRGGLRQGGLRLGADAGTGVATSNVPRRLDPSQIPPSLRPTTPTVVDEVPTAPGPLEFPAEIEAKRQAKIQHIESAAPDGADPIVRQAETAQGSGGQGQPPVAQAALEPAGTSNVPPIENRLLAQAGPGKVANERLDQSMLRFHEAAIENAKREIGDFVTEGNNRLFRKGIGVRSGTSLAARPEDIPALDRLHDALHNPSKVTSGEMQVPFNLQEDYDAVRGGMDFESAARIDFDPEMATVADYMYRGWKPPAGMFSPKATGPRAGAGRLVTTPAFKKPRVNATYREMRDAGFEPLFWNPYEQLRVARLQGVRYREQMELVEALKSLGDDMIRPHEGGPIPPGWRVPEVGPAFEGKPFATVDPQTGEARAMFTRRWLVRNEIANPLESMYGKRPDLGDIRVGGKNINILKAVDWAVFTPKRAKLFGSFFQQIDFTTRAGIGSWHGMVNALTTGHPIEAVQHLALYPKTATDILQAYFRPNFRMNLKKQLNSTEALIQERPGVSLKGISDAGLSILDITILPTDLDSVVREVARESGLVRAGKALPRAVLALEGAMRRGLFEGVYPAAIINDVKNNIAPIVARTYPNLTDAQMNSTIAMLANKRYSTLPASQSVIQNQAVRETLRRVMFSLNESEGLLRQATGTIKGPTKRFWIENWLGAYLFLMTTAGAIHWVSTGKLLPFDRFTPVSGESYGPLPFGYNRNFAAPDIPFVTGKGDIKLTLDIVGQMDTAFRVLDPISFATSRESVPIRAFENQRNAENFFGNEIDTVGPGGVASRTVQLAQDLFSPIGFGQAGTELLREKVPEGLIAGGEERIGLAGQLIQASGANVRGEIINTALKRMFPNGPSEWSNETYDKRRKQLLEDIFGVFTERETELRAKEIDEFFNVPRRKANRDSFFGRDTSED